MPSVAMRLTSDWASSAGCIGAICVSPRSMGAGPAQPASTRTSVNAGKEIGRAVLRRMRA